MKPTNYKDIAIPMNENLTIPQSMEVFTAALKRNARETVKATTQSKDVESSDEDDVVVREAPPKKVFVRGESLKNAGKKSSKQKAKTRPKRQKRQSAQPRRGRDTDGN